MGQKKILVVDFDQEFLQFLSQFLRDEDFLVSTAADGSDGLEKWRTESPDLVVTEAMLPKLHGFELCSRITQSATQKVPVIIVTGVYKDTIFKTEATRMFGASAYFEKPLDPASLLVSIRKILNLPASTGRRGDDLDEAIMEALASAPLARGSAESQLQTDGHPNAKKKMDKKQDEIETMLQSTLVELGLKAGKKKTSAEPPEIKPTAQNLIRETKSVPAKPKAAMTPLPPPAEENKPDVSFLTPAFGEFTEANKRSFSPRILWAAAGITILMSAMVLFLRPRRSASPEQEVTPPIAQVATLETRVPEAVEPQTPDPATAEPEVKQNVRIPIKTVAKKPPVDKPAETAPLAVAEIKPPVPNPESLLPLQAPDSIGTDTEKKTVLEQAAAAGETIISQSLEPAPIVSAEPEPKPEPPAAPEVKFVTGDLVPFENVDVQPKVIKAVEPVYPPAGLSMRLAGNVTVNALVSETGDVIQTAVVQGIKGALGFNQAAETAVRKWKFSPAEKGGVKVRVWKPITIIFKLKS